MSATVINEQHEFILTGGLLSDSNKALSHWYRVVLDDTFEFNKQANMISERFKHTSVYLQNCVYVIGGLHLDSIVSKSVQSTLSSCERYINDENWWQKVASMITPRYNMAITTFQGIYAYCFGGYNDSTLLDTIEKYDAILDTWIEISVTLPFKIAKLGAAELIPDESILLWGGQYHDETALSNTNTVYKFDLKQEKLYKMISMNQKRTLPSLIPAIDNQIFAFGGWGDHTCEKYDKVSNKWVDISSYTSIAPNYDLSDFTIVNLN